MADFHGRDRWRCKEAGGDRWRERRDDRDKKELKVGLAAGAIGLALGAIIIGAAQEAERKRQDDRYGRNDSNARCFARYRTYHPRNGTFVGRDGRRFQCR
ncbi:BA14K family protein [Ensifer canadensis]